MSDADKINASGPKLNAAASEFVPGQYASKSSTTPKVQGSSGAGPKQGGGSAPSNNRPGSFHNNNRGGRNPNYSGPNAGMAQPYFPPGAQYGLDQSQQIFLYQMNQLAAQQGLMYDPTSGMMFDPSTGVFYMMAPAGFPMMAGGIPPMVPGAVPGMPMMAPAYGVAGMVPGAEVLAGAEEAPVSGEEAAAGDESAAAVPAAEGVESTSVVASEEVPAKPAPSAAKYVPPSVAAAASAPATTASAPATTQVTEKLAGLTIDAEQDVLVDIECPTPGAIIRYSKNVILGLYNTEGTVIPACLKEYFSAADYAIGSVDGSKFCRAPLASLSSLAESGASFAGGAGRGKGSQNNLRHSQSGNNLERNNSTSSFGNARHEGGNRRRNNNRDGDRDREPGEIVEGDDGFVAPEGGEESSPRERTNRRSNRNVPAVYKSKFALDASDPLAIVRKANLILNKMSVTNFEKLKDEFLVLLQTDAGTDETLQKAIEALVAKAQMEENFCFVYADLCRNIIDTWTALEPEDGTFATAQEEEEAPAPAPAAEGETEGGEAAPKKERVLRSMGKIFKDGLISRCQSEFEFDHIAALKEIRERAELSPEERTEKEILLKKRTTGHMRFIGELYMQELIAASTMKNQCLERLLSSTVEEELVCLCKLFQTIGAKIEKYHIDKSRQKKYKAQNMQDVIPAYFERIRVIGDTHPSSRVRFMMKDLIDMRNNDWTARREEEKMVNLVKKNDDFAPVQTAFHSNDARNSDAFAAPAVDEWSVVQTAGRKKPMGSGAPSPVPGGALSRSSSNAQISRSNSTSTTNLSGMGRGGPRGPGAPPAPSAAGGFKKEKSGGRGGGRDGARDGGKDSGKAPRAGARPGSESPVPSAVEGDGADAPAEVSYATDIDAIQKKVRSAMKEFYGNGILEEPCLTFQELKPSPQLMAVVVKDMVGQAVETSSEKSCASLCELLEKLRTLTVTGAPAPLLTSSDVKEAIYLFLNNFDEVLIDAPKAGVLGASIVANLCCKDLLSLDLFTSLPEDNDFAFSAKFVEFVVQVLAALNGLCGAARAEELYRAAGLDLLAKVNAPPRETPEDVLKALGTKFGVAYLI